jgi:hypothetical protein
MDWMDNGLTDNRPPPLPRGSGGSEKKPPRSWGIHDRGP